MNLILIIIISLGSFIFVSGIASCQSAQSIGDSKKPYVVKITSIGDINKSNVKINSHANETEHSSLELNYRTYTEIGKNILETPNANYARILKISDDRYMLCYQAGKPNGVSIYYSMSRDLKNWSDGTLLFSTDKILNGTDTRCFSNCNPIVLQNGDILAVSSYRANHGYSTEPQQDGIMMRRSTDGGISWGPEKIIYIGANWEPYILQLKSGELEVYFTQEINITAPNQIPGNSVTSMIISNDNGKTWEPAIGKQPYKIIRQIIGVENGVTVYTDQMPIARELNNGTIAVALESELKNNSFWISMAYTDKSEKWKHLAEGGETGPKDRRSNIFSGAGPYLVQFPSGETALSYNSNKIFTMRIGDSGAWNFGQPYSPFSGKGFWGAMQIINGRTLVATMANDVDGGPNKIMVGRIVLNHRIYAPFSSVDIDGNNQEWKNNTQFLFIGSDSPKQAIFRFYHDSDNIYLLVEVLDNYIVNGDEVVIYLKPDGGNNNDLDKNTLKVNLGPIGNGVQNTFRYLNGSWAKTPNNGVISSLTVDGAVEDNSSIDKGYLVELAIPKSLLEAKSDTLLFDAVLQDNNSSLGDTFNLSKTNDPKSWMRVCLESH